MKEQLKPDRIVGIRSTDVIRVELDINKDSTCKREVIKMYVDKNKIMDERDVISKVKTKMKYKFSKGDFRKKYSEFEPGDKVELNIVSWLRQPML